MRRHPADPDQLKRWVAFRRKHMDAIAAMDFFTVPTVSLRLLNGFFVVEHGRRHILHFNATFDPIAAWVIQQLWEAFPYDTAPKYLIFDHDAIFSPAVVTVVKGMGIKPRRIISCSLWQNGVAERWVGSCRRDPPATRSRLWPAPPRLARTRLHQLPSRGPLSFGTGQGHATQTIRHAATIT